MRIKLLFTDKSHAFIIAYVDCEYNGLLHPKSFYLSGGRLLLQLAEFSHLSEQYIHKIYIDSCYYFIRPDMK